MNKILNLTVSEIINNVTNTYTYTIRTYYRQAIMPETDIYDKLSDGQLIMVYLKSSLDDPGVYTNGRYVDIYGIDTANQIIMIYDPYIGFVYIYTHTQLLYRCLTNHLVQVFPRFETLNMYNHHRYIYKFPINEVFVMKKVRFLISIFILISIGLLFGIVGHADIVDDFCAKYDYDYRWTVEFELDETYKDTTLYEISDNGRLQFSYISLPQPIEVTGRQFPTHEFFAYSGKYEFITTGYSGDNSTINPFTSYCTFDDDGIYIVKSDQPEHPLYEFLKNPTDIDKFMIRFLRRLDDIESACVIIT